jgi:hypothetical protein
MVVVIALLASALVYWRMDNQNDYEQCRRELLQKMDKDPLFDPPPPGVFCEKPGCENENIYKDYYHTECY